jgi:hypothetical protein
MIIVTAAKGRPGRAVVEHLIERAPVEEIGVSVGEPDGARCRNPVSTLLRN